ncbi:pentapeptide repeat-containing protein [Trichothermofontia sp.]
MTRSRFAAVMSQSSPAAPQIVVKNRYPDYLTLTLAAVPVAHAGSSSPNPNAAVLPTLDLQITLQFGHHWEVQADHRAQFGLTGGRLTLEVDQGELSSALTVVADSAMPIVVRRVSDGLPTYAWQLVSTADFTVLNDTIASLSLGHLQPHSPDCRVLITLTVSAPDIHLTDAEGLWRHDISPNKHAVLERKLVWSLVEPRFHPYLSWAEMTYRPAQPSPKTLIPMPSMPSAASLQTIQPVIDTIMAAESDRLPDLAKLAGLDMMHDFAGGNLQGTNLSGLDLSGANLSRVNLRGADLSDADLSEATLRDAKLSGADLSGAYLSNADLRHTDFHRASLALATLSGANLEGANLREANLSSTHLGHANVKQAIFGHNPGLTIDSEQSLRERGALFPDL